MVQMDATHPDKQDTRKNNETFICWLACCLMHTARAGLDSGICVPSMTSMCHKLCCCFQSCLQKNVQLAICTLWVDFILLNATPVRELGARSVSVL